RGQAAQRPHRHREPRLPARVHALRKPRARGLLLRIQRRRLWLLTFSRPGRMSEASHHPATAWVNLDRIRDNYKALRAHAGALSVLPVLKANAYGHGAIEVARALSPLGITMFAVA